MNITKKTMRDLQILMCRSRCVHQHREYWRVTHPIISMTGNGEVSFHVSQDDAHFYHANYRSRISVREWAERVQRQALNINRDYGKFGFNPGTVIVDEIEAFPIGKTDDWLQ